MRLLGRLPSAPPSEPSLRRLGVKSASQLEKPIRAQTVVAIAAAVVLIALPLYLLRRPPEAPATKDAALPAVFQPSVPSPTKTEAVDSPVSVGPPERVRCGPSPTAVGQSGRLCDALPFFETSLKEAIVGSVDCAPRTREGGTLNYVLKVDFAQKQMHVFPGRSGSWHGPQARHATKCVKQGLKAPDWDKIQHQYRYYEIAVLGTYRPPAPTTTPLFE
jgi:hypothetical protein